MYYAESDKYIIVWPKSKADFQNEGQLQHNCVGGYFDRVVKRKTTVFFFRYKENEKEPFCTIEFKGDKLIQCRTKYNQDAPEEVMQFMKKISSNYIKEMNKKATNEILNVAAV